MVNVHLTVLKPMLNIDAYNRVFSKFPLGEVIFDHRKEIPECGPVYVSMTGRPCQERCTIKSNSTPLSLP